MEDAPGTVGRPPSSVHAPFFRRPHLYVLTALAALYVATSAFLPIVWVQFPLGFLILFIIPGYAIGWLALAPRDRWPWTLTFALVVGWSVAANVAVGILLLVLHLGLPPVVFGGYAFALIEAALVVDIVRGAPAPGPAGAPSPLAASLRLTGYRPAQRVAAYGLLSAILLVIVVIVVLASIFPNNSPALAFSITGYGGTSANLPPVGTINHTLEIEAIVQNNVTAQSFTLEVRSAIQNASVPYFNVIPWKLPLSLENGTMAIDPVSLTALQTVTVAVVFEFPHAGDFVLQFLLDAPGGAVVGRATWTVAIT
ncbi:MAG: hypothetical protein ACYDFT_08730 [Thermoplasmata archaeon]